MTSTTLTRSAERPAIAPLGSLVLIRIAAILRAQVWNDCTLDYMGTHIQADVQDCVTIEGNLVCADLEARLLAHDGCVSYTVAVGKALIRVHECNIREVLE